MKKWIKYQISCAIAHFAICFIFGIIYISIHGLTKNQICNFFELTMGFFVIKMGLPDTMLGWIINSIIYGSIIAIMIILIQKLIISRSVELTDKPLRGFQ